MGNKSIPRDYKEWKQGQWERKEDAANTFGYHLIQHCRNEAVASLPTDMNVDDKRKATEAIDIALHNVMDLVEGFWKLASGPDNCVEYHLQVVVKDRDHNEIEKIEIAPGMDLPIGYWKWANDGEFK